MNKARETVIIIKRPRKVHAAHHGGAWKVAFADFMTSMMALFLVLWIVTQSSDVRAAVAGYFQDPLGRAKEFGTTIVKGESQQPLNPHPISQTDITNMQQQLMAQLGERIKQKLSKTPEFKSLASHIEIEITNDGLRIQLLEDSTGVFFQTGSAVPRPEVAKLISAVGQELATVPNPVMIEGYTDAVQYRVDAPYTNWELSADRANVARHILIQGGLHESQIWEVRGHADRELRLPNNPTAASNRRVTITMLFDMHPGSHVDGGAPAPDSTRPGTATPPAAAGTDSTTASTAANTAATPAPVQ